MDKILEIANSPFMWLFSMVVIIIVITQAVIFIRLVRKNAAAIDMTMIEVNKALRTGVISALGPSLGIIIIAVSLITVIGAPLTLMRIGIIGSAAYELTAAGIGAKAFGVELGKEGYNLQAFTTAVWAMCLGGLGWLLSTTLFTKSLGKAQKKIAAKNTKIMALVSTAAMLGAFGYFTAGQITTSVSNSMVVIISAITMAFLMMIAEKRNAGWLKEWALGITLVVGMSFGYVTTIF
ncbi:DUF5058 family protein [Fictibacillus enclensis]|uniref:DUF5058 family protein n=1 Tax=Fictibacillus enclensis TaxID=1017270 RepID=UPI0025A027B9|nr:DUF5058 family protein [Fictibacillus enclensis]MDM5197204.1 DUF5058 family protein [Fictibacillus enclensis]